MKQTVLLGLVLSASALGQTVEFKLHQGYLIVTKCSVGSLHDLVAVVDTGVTESVIDSRIAKILALPTSPDTATLGTHDSRAEAVLIPNLKFGPLYAESLAGIAIDLSYLTREFGIRPDILIGMDMLGRESFLIDYKAKKIVFGSPPLMAHSAPLRPGKRLLLVEAAAGKKVLRLQVDTGFNAILIYGGIIPAVPQPTPSARTNLAGRGTDSQLISLPQLQIGNWRGRQIAAAVTDDAPRDDPGFDGLFGPVSIGVHRITFDFEKSVMNWE